MRGGGLVMRRAALRAAGPALLLGLWLVACGAGESAPGAAVAADDRASGSRSLAEFDFARGTAFPQRARVSIGDVAVAPEAREVHVPITLDRPTPNTIHARVMTRNGRFPGTAAIEGRHFTKVDTVVVFRPGDPLTRTVRVALKGVPKGAQFELHFPEGVDGARAAGAVGTVQGVAGAAPSAPKSEGFRAPRRFAPVGEPAYRFDPARARWSDGGGPGVFSTRLPHGRTQPGNAETGLYLDPEKHRAAPQPPIAVEGGALVLRSQQLSAPIRHEGADWHHGAAVLTGERMPEVQLTYGQYEWEAQMPDRRGAWPALWLLPVGGGWPPEIDVYEGFGDSPDWRFARDISANLHGGSGGKRGFTVPMRIDARRFYGLSGFAEGYHRFAVDIAPDFVTWFVDGVEVYQAVNPFAGTRWFPLMNVAVKHEGTYEGGSGTMRLRAFRMWRSDADKRE